MIGPFSIESLTIICLSDKKVCTEYDLYIIHKTIYNLFIFPYSLVFNHIDIHI